MLPWMLGALLFFAFPLLQSFLFSFQEVKITDQIAASWVGFRHYINAFTKDPEYIRTLMDSMVNMLYEVPIIIIYSLYMAIIINQKFKGRFFFRAMMFLPVVVSSGIVIAIMKEDLFAQSVVKQGGSDPAFLFQSTGIEDLFIRAGIAPAAVQFVTGIINRIFDTLWKSGVQILLFLSALQSVPDSAYEAASVEGSTAWETFWLITFPLVSPTILVNIIYTIVDSFNDYGNPVLRSINQMAFVQFRYSYSAAMAWIYSIAVLIIIGLVQLILSRKVFYMSEN